MIIKKIGMIACLLMCSLFSNASDVDILVEKMIFDDNAGVQKIAAKMIYAQPKRTEAVGDALAYLLMDGAKRNNDASLTSWVAKAFGALDNPRYQQVLESALLTTTSSKIKKQIRNSLAKITKTFNEDLVTFDINQYDRAAALKRLTNRYIIKDSIEDLWGEISVGNSIDKTLEVFGMPYIIDDKINYGRPILSPPVVVLRTQSLVLKYENMGYVALGSHGGKLSVEAMSATYQVFPGFSDENNAEFINELLMGTAVQYRIAAKSICENRRFAEEILDAGAQRAWQERSTSGRGIDGVAWLVKCIGASGNPRYKSILTDIQDESKVRKIRKYAKKAIIALRNSDVDQYIIGDQPSAISNK